MGNSVHFDHQRSKKHQRPKKQTKNYYMAKSPKDSSKPMWIFSRNQQFWSNKMSNQVGIRSKDWSTDNLLLLFYFYFSDNDTSRKNRGMKFNFILAKRKNGIVSLRNFLYIIKGGTEGKVMRCLSRENQS